MDVSDLNFEREKNRDNFILDQSRELDAGVHILSEAENDCFCFLSAAGVCASQEVGLQDVDCTLWTEGSCFIQSHVVVPSKGG